MRASDMIAPVICIGLMAATVFGITRCTRTDNYQVVAVKAYPEKGYYTLEDTGNCLANRIYNVPAVRTFKSGRTQSYTIQSFNGLVGICK